MGASQSKPNDTPSKTTAPPSKNVPSKNSANESTSFPATSLDSNKERPCPTVGTAAFGTLVCPVTAVTASPGMNDIIPVPDDAPRSPTRPSSGARTVFISSTTTSTTTSKVGTLPSTKSMVGQTVPKEITVPPTTSTTSIHSPTSSDGSLIRNCQRLVPTASLASAPLKFEVSNASPKESLVPAVLKSEALNASCKLAGVSPAHSTRQSTKTSIPGVSTPSITAQSSNITTTGVASDNHRRSRPTKAERAQLGFLESFLENQECEKKKGTLILCLISFRLF